jgi:hypothetical protein
MATVAARPLVLRRWERWEPLTGALFAFLFFVGQDLLVLDAPGESASAKRISSFYANKGNYHQVVVGKLLVILSVVFFVWFVALLTTRLRAAEGEPGKFARTAVAGGVACASFLGAEVVFGTAIGSGLTFSKEFRRGALDPQLVRLMDGIAYSLLILALLTAAVLIAASSIVARRTSIFPAWLRWSGIVIAVLLIPAATVAPLGVVLLALWSLVVSAVLFFEAQATSSS